MGTRRDRSFLLQAAALAAALGTAGLSHASPPLPSAPPSTEAPAPQPDDEAARAHAELRKQGNEAAKAGQIPEAIEAWAKAYAVRPVFAVACAIGRAELLGRANPAPAALWLTRCLRLAPVPVKGQAKELAAQQEELVLRDLARSRVGALRIEAEPDAEISVDGRSVGKAPLGDEVFLEPGSHRITVSLGSRSRSKDVVVAGGEARALDLGVQAALHPLWFTAPPPAPVRSAKSSFPIGWLLVGAGMAGGVVLGGVLSASSDAVRAQSEEVLGSLKAQGDPTIMCTGATEPPACTEHRQLHMRAELLGIGSTSSFVAAGVVAIGTLTFVFWPKKPDSVGIKADARGVRAVWSW
jgi:hypothetical protein